METRLLKKYGLTLLGTLLGGVGGFLYWKFVGCSGLEALIRRDRRLLIAVVGRRSRPRLRARIHCKGPDPAGREEQSRSFCLLKFLFF